MWPRCCNLMTFCCYWFNVITNQWRSIYYGVASIDVKTKIKPECETQWVWVWGTCGPWPAEICGCGTQGNYKFTKRYMHFSWHYNVLSSLITTWSLTIGYIKTPGCWVYWQFTWYCVWFVCKGRNWQRKFH